MDTPKSILGTITHWLQRQHFVGIADLLHERFYLHTMMEEFIPSPQSDRQVLLDVLSEVRSAFEQFRCVQQRVYGNDDYAILHLHCSGRFEKKLFHYQPDGQYHSWDEIHMIGVKDGKITDYLFASTFLSQLIKEAPVYSACIMDTVRILFSPSNYEELRQTFSSEFIDYSAPCEDEEGFEDFIQRLATMQATYGEIQVTLHKVITNGEYVFCWNTYKSKTLNQDTLEMYAFDPQGLICERWVFKKN